METNKNMKTTSLKTESQILFEKEELISDIIYDVLIDKETSEDFYKEMMAFYLRNNSEALKRWQEKTLNF